MLKDKVINNNLKNEIDFCNYIDFNNNYPLKENNYKFIIIKSAVSKNELYELFEGLLISPIVLEFNNYYICIYHNKDKISFKDYYDTICDDLGINLDLFEGFLIQVKNNQNLNDFIEIFDKYFDKLHSYCNMNNLVSLIENKEEIKKLANIFLDKYLNDLEFIKIVKNLFKNDLNISKTASDLYIHRNTLNNRLSNFEYETGLQIQKFTDALTLYELLK